MNPGAEDSFFRRFIFCACVFCALFFLLALAFLALFPDSGILPECLFKRITGLMCPTCGATRSLHSLLRLDLATAFSLNPFFLCVMLPAFAAAWILALLASVADSPRMLKLSGLILLSTVAAGLVYGLFRNFL